MLFCGRLVYHEASLLIWLTLFSRFVIARQCWDQVLSEQLRVSALIPQLGDQVMKWMAVFLRLPRHPQSLSTRNSYPFKCIREPYPVGYPTPGERPARPRLIASP